MKFKDEKIDLVKWLEHSNETFVVNDTEIKFFSLYETLKIYLSPILEEITKGAILESIKIQISELDDKIQKAKNENNGEKSLEKEKFNYEKILWLNDHGPHHIKTVIKRASNLVNCDIDLTSREVYCLLSAILIHDIGNFYGRLGHEKKILEIANEGSNKIGSDHVERKYIIEIAQSHGGKVADTNDKDTISKLKKIAPVLDEQVRLRLIASILRFADELADERFRGDSKLLLENRLPKCSEIYHAYSLCLSSTIIDHENHTIELHFDIPREFIEKPFGKDDKEVFLIDEIETRTLKMHIERLYCSRFWKPHIDLERILVIMNFYDDDLQGAVHPEVTFTLSENGYPLSNYSIFTICPDLILPDGTEMNGLYFKNKIGNHAS